MTIGTIKVAGGVYLERCMRPGWSEVFGSGGRAASALTALGSAVELHTYAGPLNGDAIRSRSALENFRLSETAIASDIAFGYIHGLDTPHISSTGDLFPSLCVQGEHVVRFGFLEGNVLVDAEYCVYDPQNVTAPEHFHANGSKAKHLALVLNGYEAGVLSGMAGASAQDMAVALATQASAEVVIIKQGPKGALVYEQGRFEQVPAFETGNVWKVGSGDTFVATFAHFWMGRRLSASQAAEQASKATAFYCHSRGLATESQLSSFKASPIAIGSRMANGETLTVYLAGPFFTLAQLWVVEQARQNLRDMGLRVFSPFHDVGHGSADDVVPADLAAIDQCDLVLAIADGLDAGTIYEIGYARAREKPVVIYCENESEEDKKMMLGSGCFACTDYVTAIYKTLWIATSL